MRFIDDMEKEGILQFSKQLRKFFHIFDYMYLRIYPIPPPDCDCGETEGNILFREKHPGIPGSNN